MRNIIKIATRSSELAINQSHQIGKLLRVKGVCRDYELFSILTKPDLDLTKPVYELGGKRSFLLELESCLHANSVDIAVHSFKDVPAAPAELDDDFIIMPILSVNCFYDCLVANFPIKNIASIPKGAVVGTSSLRRQYQMQALRPDLQFKLCRGNVNTRLNKLDAGEFDILILATAGLIRLGLENRITYKFSIDEMVPSAGQGVIAVQILKSDNALISDLEKIHNIENLEILNLERLFIEKIGATCATPVGIKIIDINNNELSIFVFLASNSGDVLINKKIIIAKNNIYQFINTLSEEILEHQEHYV